MGTYFVIAICILAGVRTEVVILITHVVISHTGVNSQNDCHSLFLSCTVFPCHSFVSCEDRTEILILHTDCQSMVQYEN